MVSLPGFCNHYPVDCPSKSGYFVVFPVGGHHGEESCEDHEDCEDCEESPEEAGENGCEEAAEKAGLAALEGCPFPEREIMAKAAQWPPFVFLRRLTFVPSSTYS